MANPSKPDPTPAAADAAPAPVAAPTVSVADELAALKAQLAAKDAQIDKLTELATRPSAPPLYDMAAMTGVEGTRNARPETGGIPLHFTHGTPVFKAERPTGKAG